MRHREEMLERKAREAAEAAEKENGSEQQVAAQSQPEPEEGDEMPDSETDDLADSQFDKNDGASADDVEDEEDGLTGPDRTVGHEVPDRGPRSAGRVAGLGDGTKGENG